jgi:hypothetical protein
MLVTATGILMHGGVRRFVTSASVMPGSGFEYDATLECMCCVDKLRFDGPITSIRCCDLYPGNRETGF